MMTSVSNKYFAIPRATVALLAFGFSVTACSAKDKAKSDTAMATPAPASASMKPDSLAVTGDASSMSGTPAGTADPDRDFLRMMSNHHKGLIALVHMTQDRSGVGTAKADATSMDKAQDAELDKMMTMLEKTYKDPYAPKVMPEHQAMAVALKPMSGKGYERTFYQDIVAHHKEGIAMIDGYLPNAKSADIKAMAEKMKADQSREITDFQQKLSKLGA